MLTCPLCNNPYRTLTSRPISTDIREYSCHCKHCGARFRQYGVFESYLVENKSSQPPNATLQPDIARRREKLLSMLEPDIPKHLEKGRASGMVFRNAMQ